MDERLNRLAEPLSDGPAGNRGKGVVERGDPGFWREGEDNILGILHQVPVVPLRIPQRPFHPPPAGKFPLQLPIGRHQLGGPLVDHLLQLVAVMPHPLFSPLSLGDIVQQRHRPGKAATDVNQPFQADLETAPPRHSIKFNLETVFLPSAPFQRGKSIV